MPLNFKNWWENLNDPSAIKKPEEMADYWKTKLPQEPPKQNEHEISIFVSNMADPAKNGDAIAQDLNNYPVYDPRYDHIPIAGNLLDNVNSEKLQDAAGIVTNQFDPEFLFHMGGARAGRLLIQHPPLIFDQIDKELLRSIIFHELGHALDWLNPKFRTIKPSGRYRWNATKYARNIHEARRLSDQLRYLVQRIGDVDKILAALSGQKLSDTRVQTLQQQLLTAPDKKAIQDQIDHINKMASFSPFRLSPALLPVAKAFLSQFKVQKENWFAKLAAPLLLASNPYVGKPAEPVAMTAKQDETEMVQAAAHTVKVILDLLRFHEFF